MENKLKEWVRTFGSGSTNAGKYDLKAFNDKYSLIQLKGGSGYAGRMSGSVYTPSEWLVCENFDEINRSIPATPKNLFYCEGRLTKEHKEKILKEYGLKVEVVKKTIKKFLNRKLLFFEKDAFWGGMNFSSPLGLCELLSEDENEYIIYSKLEKRKKTIKKNKFFTKVLTLDEANSESINLSGLIYKYDELISQANEKKKLILKFMDNE